MQQSTSLIWWVVVLVVLAVGAWWLYPKIQAWTQGAAVGNTSSSSSSSSSGDAALTPAVRAARQVLADDLGVGAETITVVRVTPSEWPDGCLGLAEEGEMCTQAIVPGFQIVFSESGQQFTYRTNESGSVVRLESPRK